MTLRKQLDLMDEVRRKSNINLVTCGKCGTLLLHKTKDEIVECYACKSMLAECDCPDFLYEGMPELDDEL